MAIDSNDALIGVLQQCRLLPPQRLGEALALVDQCGNDLGDAAKKLVEQGWFTTYQMSLLLAGRIDELMLGPYVILDRLSKSNRCEVYKGRHLDQNCLVALKVIRVEQLATPAAVNHFLVLIQALAELDHPNIVQFCDADQAGDAYFCAMEFVEGTDLDTVVRQGGKLSPPVASEYVRQAALGLQYAHEHNLVNRDIKPVNLFLTDQGAPSRPILKILDWGLATLKPPTAQEEEIVQKASEHALVGTADYLSPEQALHPDHVDIRSDLYSLGCTLYFLLTAQTPFSGASVMQKALQHMNAEPEAVEKLSPEVPRGLAAIVRRMMAKPAKDRFQTPAAVALALSAFCRGSLVNHAQA